MKLRQNDVELSKGCYTQHTPTHERNSNVPETHHYR